MSDSLVQTLRFEVDVVVYACEARAHAEAWYPKRPDIEEMVGRMLQDAVADSLDSEHFVESATVAGADWRNKGRRSA